MEKNTYEYPLDSAIEWARDQPHFLSDGAPARMMVLSYEFLSAQSRRTYRKYRVMDIDMFSAEYAGKALPDDQRHVHEVVAGPCKCYFDLEFVKEANPTVDGDVLARTFIDAIVATLRRDFNVSCPTIVTLGASNADKFSQHVIITLEEGNTTAFASNEDVGAFVTRFLADHPTQFTVKTSKGTDTPLCDMNVYKKKHTMRMFGSGKIGEPSRKFLPHDTDVPAHGPYPTRLFMDSCITQPIPATATLLTVASPNASRKAMSRSLSSLSNESSTASSSDSDSTLHKLVMSVPNIVAATPIMHRVNVNHERLSVHVPCMSTQCALQGDAHSSNKIFFTIDLVQHRYQQLCFSDHCKAKRRLAPWKALPPDTVPWCRLFLKDGLGSLCAPIPQKDVEEFFSLFIHTPPREVACADTVT